MTNIDNINADQVPYLIEQLIKKGAGNVHVINAMTKKGRPEFIFLIDAPKEEATSIGKFLSCEIGTLGVRIIKTDHMEFKYSMETIKVCIKDSNNNRVWEDTLQVKVVRDESGKYLSARGEYEDLKACVLAIQKIGLKITFYEFKQMVESEANRCLSESEFKYEFEVIKEKN